MSGVSIISFYSILIAAAFIAAIGLDLLFRKPKRREERPEERASRAPVAEGVDPVSLREFRPFTQRLSGAVLLLAVGVILFALRSLVL